jgi:hypothetical protein
MCFALNISTSLAPRSFGLYSGMGGGKRNLPARGRFDQTALFGYAFERDQRLLPVVGTQKDISYLSPRAL